MRIVFSEATGIEAGTTAKLQQVCAGRRAFPTPQAVGYLRRMVMKQVFSTQCVKPAAALEQAIGGGTTATHDVGADWFCHDFALHPAPGPISNLLPKAPGSRKPARNCLTMHLDAKNSLSIRAGAR
ncbi:hypothetical protein GCM10022270_22590 [Terriglobus aquaticus]